MDKLIIFDTTLRDGEQAPGASLDPQEKLEIAHQLAALKVDVVEAGFPVSSEGDFNSVKLVATHLKGPTVCALARAVKKDIDAASLAIKKAARGRIHVFLATSKIHMQYKLRKAEEEILRIAVEMVRYARGLCGDIEFSPEDASRTERDFLFRVVEAVIKAGAKTVNIPDTVGYATPLEFSSLIREIRSNVPNINKAIISVHCHNDLGLAVANSLAAVQAGARQVECTVNGLGERAGNASMEEIVMSIKTRQDLFPVKIGIMTRQIYKASRLVCRLTGFVIQPNKAIVGANAFRHESGIHQDGVLKKASTYEIMKPEDVGFTGHKLVLGKHSGRHAFDQHLRSLGFKLSGNQLEKAFSQFKHLADKKKTVYDEDLVAIVEDEIRDMLEYWHLESLYISCGTQVIPTATVSLKTKEGVFKMSSIGDGPVDATYKAIEKIVGIKAELQDYRLEAVTKGKDAVGEVAVKLKVKSQVVIGRGVSTDIIEASAKAYLNAINKSLLPYKRI